MLPFNLLGQSPWILSGWTHDYQSTKAGAPKPTRPTCSQVPDPGTWKSGKNRTWKHLNAEIYQFKSYSPSLSKWGKHEKSNLLQIVDAIVGPGFTNLASCKNHCIAKGQQLGTMIHYKNYNAIDSSGEEQICRGVHLVFSLEHPTIHQQCHFSPTFRDSPVPDNATPKYWGRKNAGEQTLKIHQSEGSKQRWSWGRASGKPQTRLCHLCGSYVNRASMPLTPALQQSPYTAIEWPAWWLWEISSETIIRVFDTSLNLSVQAKKPKGFPFFGTNIRMI